MCAFRLELARRACGSLDGPASELPTRYNKTVCVVIEKLRSCRYTRHHKRSRFLQKNGKFRKHRRRSANAAVSFKRLTYVSCSNRVSDRLCSPARLVERKKTASSPLSPRHRGFLRGTRVPFRSVSALADASGVSTRVPGDVQERLAAFPGRRLRRTRRLLRRRAVPFHGEEDFGRFGREAHRFFFFVLRPPVFAVAPESDGFGTRHQTSRLFTRRGASLFGNEKRSPFDAIAFRRRREREGVHRGRRRRRRRGVENANTFLFAKRKGNETNPIGLSPLELRRSNFVSKRG